MVVHDPQRQQQWAQQRAVVEKKKHKAVERNRRWSVLGVQSVACATLLLLAFVLKLAGGGAYEELKRSFHKALEENQLMAVLSELFEEDEESEKEQTFTEGETQENQEALMLDAAMGR